MDKKRKWHLALILTVVALTVYNILPTLFYYSKPLKSPVSAELAETIGTEIAARVDNLEAESVDWIGSFCKLIDVKPLYISASAPNQVSVVFAKSEEANHFRKLFPRAASLIPFFPAQMGIAPESENPKEILVVRRIPVRLSEISNLFSYIPKKDGDAPSESYQALIADRLESITNALSSGKVFAAPRDENPDHLLDIASSIQILSKLYDQNQELAVRFARAQSEEQSGEAIIASFDRFRDFMKEEKKEKSLSAERVNAVESQELKIASAAAFIKKHAAIFSPGKATEHPFFKTISVDWQRDLIRLELHPDVLASLSILELKQLLIREVAKIGRITGEEMEQTTSGYSIALQKMENASGFLVLKLDRVGEKIADQALEAIKTQWHPTHPDLAQLPIVTEKEYETLPIQDKALSLIVSNPKGSKSVYVHAKGIERILKAYEKSPESDHARLFMTDFRALSNLLATHGFGGYRFGPDFIFENRNFFESLLGATREEFTVLGSKRNAVLELSDVEQRILATNKIETRIHEDLIKWADEYKSAQVSLNTAQRYDVPEPTKSIFWNNLKLSFDKLVRGDDRKILRWGLDLSGGKTVEIELRDQNNRIVREEADLKQGVNELFNRVNKMGVSDVSIRKVGNHIVLDFPGGQALSAADLVKASSMYFHIVNEKFSLVNPSLANSVNQFLQDVWNEAVVTNRKSSENIHAIAYRHLHGDAENKMPHSDAARILLDNGLKLANPEDYASSQKLDDSVSKIVLLRGSDYADWQGQAHPLMIVFRNHALEGAQLDQIRSNYDPSKGNYLSFEVKGSGPRSSLHAWTSQYSKEKILGTAREDYSRSRGWRMAVLLNDTVISSPTLESSLRDSASISGSFSQREVNQLVSDLKAGSLTFTPHILSEKNVSPELGKSDRTQGIAATIAALILVIVCMVAYYRYAGLVASVAVLFNLLIMWATLQNLGASLSLASIAGIILTVGMAVDANVLVFERIKEEFALNGRISTAIRAGYEKAFSAILDSNVTTIIAALILLNFDAGPIKAFAVSMIIGIASSMFTALFMTRFYFNGWLQNPKNTALKMSNWISASSIDFLKKGKIAFAVALTIIVIGGGFFFAQRSTLFGMDFTGGYALHVELAEATDPIAQVESALEKGGASPRDFQIRQHTPATHLRILFGTGMEQPGKPFANMPLEVEVPAGAHSYQKNPRIDWVVKTLEQSGLRLAPQSLSSLDLNWTAMSGQMSESMRNNALIGLLIAFLSIFIYIAFRFEYKYAISTILCLLHDVLITLGLMGLLHAFGAPIQIDLNTIAALMTIIGYSLNDTIIIFDRIREDVEIYKKQPLSQIVNRALNATLSRTAITSGTTLVVLLALLFLGGASIFSFSLVMVIGVVFGTLSSWFIASPLLLFFHRKEETDEKLVRTS